MFGTDSCDGRTLGVWHGNIFGPSSCGTMVKTEAPGLYGVGQAQGPQAWPGTFLPCHPQLCSIYSRRARLGGGTRPGQQMGSRLKRGEDEGEGQGIGPGPKARSWVVGVKTQPQAWQYPVELRGRAWSL